MTKQDLSDLLVRVEGSAPPALARIMRTACGENPSGMTKENVDE